jgi:hypothetical protein
MEFKMGSPIPDYMILKRYTDEDGEIFLEVRGFEDLYIRVTEGNRYYYKIEKTHMEGEELNLVEDLSAATTEDIPFSDRETVKTRIPTEEELLSIGRELEMSEDNSLDSETFDSPDAPEPEEVKDEPEEVNEWSEGQRIPFHMRSKCKENDYGGFTFRHNNFLYLLDNTYLVEVKTKDTTDKYQMEDKPEDTEPEVSDTPSPGPSPAPAEPKVKALDIGDTLPSIYKEQCEEDIGPGGGSRITIGDFLYFMDSKYKITQKMKISFMGSDFDSTPAGPAVLPPPHKKTPGTTPEASRLMIKDIVINLLKTVLIALQKYGISADYFKESVLGRANRETLIMAYKGDLSNLNDDTREAAKDGKTVVLQEKGYNLFKAVLIHEFYIKSTLSGRGDNMKYFLTHIAAARRDGTLDSFEDEITEDHRQQLLDFFKERADVYTDKSEIIRRIHRKLSGSILKEFKKLLDNGEKIHFDAFLILRLYENTNRLDRGDGITMMRLTRSILKYWETLANQGLSKE